MNSIVNAADLNDLYSDKMKSNTRNKITFEFTFDKGNVLVSGGMMTRLCQEGHIFKKLVHGGDGFMEEVILGPIIIMQHYKISRRAFRSLIFSLRTNDPRCCYKYRLQYESIGGFKFVDKFHMKKIKENKKTTDKKTKKTGKTVINLISDDEDDEN